jgi:hypothetical protein
MKKILAATFFSLLAMGVAAMTASPAQANGYYGGKRKMTYKRTVRKASSRVSYAVGGGRYAYGGYGAYGGRGGYGYRGNDTNVAWVGGVESWQLGNTGAQILVNWPYRGGTCNVRYTPEGTPFFTQRTSGPCDQGQLWVRGLEPGTRYVVQVAQDNWDNWSGADVARAW